jgi:hypothetical protein
VKLGPCTIASVAAFGAWLALGPGCEADRKAPAPSLGLGDLPEGIAARVGNEVIPTELVRRVAAARQLSPAAARELLIQDALFAAHARSELGETGIVAAAERAALSRALLERLRAEAHARGEPSDEEIRRLVAARWHELDRPASARTSHAVVMLDAAADRALGRRVAERIAAAVRGVTDAADFRRIAAAVPSDGARVRVEQLPAVTADGRVVPEDESRRAPPSSRFDPVFAAAANALGEAGAQSGIVESSHGLHVILVEERLPERRFPLAEIRARLRDEALASRARELEAELSGRLARATRVEVERSAAALTAQIRFGP